MPRRDLRPGDVCRVNNDGNDWGERCAGDVVVIVQPLLSDELSETLYECLNPSTGAFVGAHRSDVDLLDEEP